MTQKHDAKQALFTALTAHAGDVRNKSVLSAVESLVKTSSNNSSINWELLQGHWLLINAPNFPDRQLEFKPRYIYTLGRLTFNAFEPSGLLIEIERVTQPIFPTERDNEFTHDIIVEFKTIDPDIPELKGFIKNLAVCTFKDETTLEVKFTGGELMPLNIRDNEKMAIWLSIFGQKSTPFSLNIKEKIGSLVVKWMFGVGKASPIDLQTGKTTFAIAKSPTGILEILYLDDELRITRGKSESILISQRLIDRPDLESDSF